MDEMIEQSYDGYKLYIYKDKFELSTNVTNFIENQILKILKIKDRFQFCVSGGSTPKSVYQLLAERDIEWKKLDIFLGDERCVDPKSELSNSLMLKNSLLTKYGSKAFFYEIFSDKKVDDNLSLIHISEPTRPY